MGSNPIGSAKSKEKAGASPAFSFDPPYGMRTPALCAGVRQIDRPGDLNAGGLATAAPEGRGRRPSNPIGSANKNNSLGLFANNPKPTLQLNYGLTIWCFADEG